MVNRFGSWAGWNDELLALELQELNAADFTRSRMGYNPLDVSLEWADESQYRFGQYSVWGWGAHLVFSNSYGRLLPAGYPAPPDAPWILSPGI